MTSCTTYCPACDKHHRQAQISDNPMATTLCQSCTNSLLLNSRFIPRTGCVLPVEQRRVRPSPRTNDNWPRNRSRDPNSFPEHHLPPALSRPAVPPPPAVQTEHEQRDEAGTPSGSSSTFTAGEQGEGDEVDICLKCRATGCERLRSGPDGYCTLCNKCGVQYMRLRLPLYQTEDGKVTVVQGEDRVRVSHLGFEKKSQGRSARDLTRPVVERVEEDEGGAVRVTGENEIVGSQGEGGDENKGDKSGNVRGRFIAELGVKKVIEKNREGVVDRLFIKAKMKAQGAGV